MMHQSANSAVLAQKITDFLEAASISQVQESIAKLKALMSYYHCALLEIETKFHVLNEQFSLSHGRNPIEIIKTRIKSPESIPGKLQRRGLPLTLSSLGHLHDIAGIRVICSFIDDIYMLADCLLQQDDVRLIEWKDFIKSPKENCYRSLHLIIDVPIFLQNEKRLMKVEVQLRTIAMEFWANLEHKLCYKKDLPPEISQLTSEELFQCAEMSAQLDLRMQRVRDIIQNS